MNEQEIQLAAMNRIAFVVLGVCMAIMAMVSAVVAAAQLFSSPPNWPGALITAGIAALFALAWAWARRLTKQLRADVQAFGPPR